MVRTEGDVSYRHIAHWTLQELIDYDARLAGIRGKAAVVDALHSAVGQLQRLQREPPPVLIQLSRTQAAALLDATDSNEARDALSAIEEALG